MGLIELCFLSALMGYYLDFCMEKGNILGWYREILQKLPLMVKKPLGDCILCMNFWLCFFQSILLYNMGMIMPITAIYFIFGSCGILLIIKRIEGVYYE